MKTVAQILHGKPDHPVVTIPRGATARAAAQRMADQRVGVLLVVEGEHVVGIVSERDLARKVMPFERSADAVGVAEIMTPHIIFVDMAQTIEDCMALMTEHRLRHLPVLDHGRLAGMVSIGDVVKDLISDQRFTIEQLEHYIAGVPVSPLRSSVAA